MSHITSHTPISGTQEDVVAPAALQALWNSWVYVITASSP
jgi:hypothetical protein